MQTKAPILNRDVNALTIKEQTIGELIPEGWFRLPSDFLVEVGDKICHICGKVTWITPDANEIGVVSRLVGRIIIRRKFELGEFD